MGEPQPAGQVGEAEGRSVLALLGAALLAVAVCVTGFELKDIGLGTAAGIIALLSSGLSLACVSQNGRRLRDSRRRIDVRHHPPTKHCQPTGTSPAVEAAHPKPSFLIHPRSGPLSITLRVLRARGQ